MEIGSRAYLVEDVGEMYGSASEGWASPMRAKTQIVMKLISPGEAGERCEEHLSAE